MKIRLYRKTFFGFQEQQPDVLSEDEEAVLEGVDEDDDLIDTEDVQEPEVNDHSLSLYQFSRSMR